MYLNSDGTTGFNTHQPFEGGAAADRPDALSDYYLVDQGLAYTAAGAISERIYLAELRTGGSGDVIFLRNLPVAPTKAVDGEYYGDLTVHGELINRGVATAWVNFDGTQNPPLIRDSYNVSDVVDVGAGRYEVLFEEPYKDTSYVSSLSRKIAVSFTNASINEDINNRTESKIRVQNVENATNNDTPYVGVIIFGGERASQ